MENDKKDNSNTSFKTLNIENVNYKTILTRKFVERKPYVEHDPKKIVAFIPGVIKKIFIKEGSKVKEDNPLLVLEAMKMNNKILAPMNGVIKKIHVKQGKSVLKNDLLIEFK